MRTKDISLFYLNGGFSTSPYLFNINILQHFVLRSCNEVPLQINRDVHRDNHSLILH